MTPHITAKRALVYILISAAAVSGAFAQYRRTRPDSNAIASTGAYNDPAATMHGLLKRIKGKDLLLTTDQNQDVLIHLTHKTKFLSKDGHNIKGSDIAPGSVVSIDVAKAPDLSSLAVNVRVDGPPV
jgi:hypothetical protein